MAAIILAGLEQSNTVPMQGEGAVADEHIAPGQLQQCSHPPISFCKAGT
jgi:hypothetical protein